MSAWVVAKEHIDVLMAAGLSKPSDPPAWVSSDPSAPWSQWEWTKLTHLNVDEVGTMLWTENVASVLYRYPDCTINDMPGPAVGVPYVDGEVCYVYQDPGFQLEPAEIIQACDCYSYQSCEHPDWETSEAKRAVNAIREAAISRLLPAPGYGVWGWDSAEIEKARQERGQQFGVFVI